MRSFRHWAAGIVLACGIFAGAAAAQLPDVEALLTSQVAAGRLAVRFMGTSTILLDDGTTQILIDGFFSRPSFLQLVGPIASNPTRVDRAMARAGIGGRLKAVLVAHSHYDHALDAPAVAQRTGARLVGSSSTANIGRGAGLPDGQIDIVRDRQELDYGDFHVTVFQSPHSPNMPYPGEIAAPLTPPARASGYREGGSYSFLVRHRGFSILIQPSAGMQRELYRGVRADVVFLGIGNLASQRSGTADSQFWRQFDYTHHYWGEVVVRTRARLAIPIHWDNFTRPLDDGLRLPATWIDDIPMSVKLLKFFGRAYHVRLGAMPLFDAVDIKAAAAP